MSQNRVTVSAAALAMLATSLAVAPPAGANSAACPETIREQLLDPTGADANGSARARFRRRDDCRRDFGVEVEDVPLGAYELLVGGVLRGIVTVVADGGGTKGEIEFERPDDANHPITLSFDPLGATIEVRRDGVTYFLDVFEASSPSPDATASPTPTGTPSAVRSAPPTRTATVPRTPTTARTITPTRARTRTATVARTATSTRTLR